MSIASRPVLPLLSFAAAILVILAICLVSMMLQPVYRPAVLGGATDQLIQMPAGGLAVDAAAAKDTLALVLPNGGDHQVVER
ncbi:MAG: hypothetical protein J0H01_27705 [Rhizobiales bacterium]|nr:hypothetical protein [Hyphomicrobiales bacterium]